jgi:hypothetical protein
VICRDSSGHVLKDNISKRGGRLLVSISLRAWVNSFFFLFNCGIFCIAEGLGLTGFDIWRVEPFEKTQQIDSEKIVSPYQFM